jgi:hypothetical protein
MRIKSVATMVVSMTAIMIEKYGDHGITKIFVNKYCEMPADIQEGFTLMDICGVDYAAYTRIVLLSTFLISAAIFVMNPSDGGHMAGFSRR